MREPAATQGNTMGPMDLKPMTFDEMCVALGKESTRIAKLEADVVTWKERAAEEGRRNLDNGGRRMKLEAENERLRSALATLTLDVDCACCDASERARAALELAVGLLRAIVWCRGCVARNADRSRRRGGKQSMQMRHRRSP